MEAKHVLNQDHQYQKIEQKWVSGTAGATTFDCHVPTKDQTKSFNWLKDIIKNSLCSGQWYCVDSTSLWLYFVLSPNQQNNNVYHSIHFIDKTCNQQCLNKQQKHLSNISYKTWVVLYNC